jgi:glycosyltransferase involved in cell wall biosynthesis
MKYCLISSARWKELAFPDGMPDILPSGLYQWLSAFEDSQMVLPKTREDIEAFDIIHINMPRANIPYVDYYVKRKDSRTKIVVNIDYSVDLWQKAYEHWPIVLQEIDKADLIFHVEPYGAELLSEMLHRPVPTIPHPVNVKAIREKFLREKKPNPKPLIGVMGHRYDQNYLLPYFVFRDLDVQSFLFDHVEGESEKGIGFLYDATFGRIPHEEYLTVMSKCDIMIETATTYSYGRSVVEAAALDVPVVGGSNVSAMKILFPSLVVDNPRDVSGQKGMLVDVLNYKDPAEWLSDRIDFYSTVTCKNRLLKELGLEDSGVRQDRVVQPDIRQPLAQKA